LKKSKVRTRISSLGIKEKNTKKIDKLKATFQAILSTKLGEIESEAIGQIREAKIKEEMALKNLHDKSNTLKQEYMTIHEHEKIINEKLSTLTKQKKIEINSLSEKFEQELRHLKETFSLKSNSEKTKNKTKIKELNDRIEILSIFLS